MVNKRVKNCRQAIIVLHEIYGMNQFIEEQLQKYRSLGFDVFCPNLIDKPPFPYEESENAYNFFIKNIGFEAYKHINAFIHKLKATYDHVLLLGFSVGATIAWRCCENSLCSGVIACYGSRIRNYTDLEPACPTLLLFAREGSFNAHALVCKLQDKKQVSIIEFDAEHGFLDSFSTHFDPCQAQCAEESIAGFINECTR